MRSFGRGAGGEESKVVRRLRTAPQKSFAHIFVSRKLFKSFILQAMTELQQDCINFKENPKACGKVWRDTTPYVNDDNIPTAFSAAFGHCIITISCNTVYDVGLWFVRCEALNIETTVLGKMTAKEAAEKAVKLCKDKAEKLFAGFIVG